MEELDFIKLKKSAKKQPFDKKSVKVCVMGDCATQHISTAVKGMAYENKISLELLDTDYNQITAQTMDDASELYTFAPGFVLIFNCTQKLYEAYTECAYDKRATFAQSQFNKLKTVWERINSHITATIIQTNFIEDDDRVFGDYAAKVEGSFINQLRKLNILIAEGSNECKNVFVADMQGLCAYHGKKMFVNDALYCLAKMPVSTEALPYVAKCITDIISSCLGKIKKCCVLDLDNTLWGGVIGDDGLWGIALGELTGGHAFTSLQMWLKELKERGIILAVCSKNNEENAKEPFEKHPDMILHLDDISMFVANWEDKASNIKKIQATLNIGMDSMVFIDDNPFERNLVRDLIPDICVPELPEDPSEYLGYLKSLNLFETASFSEGDRERTKQYKAEADRVQLMESFESFDDYLKGLEMKAKVSPFDKFSYPRISQLTQRSNQFNLRTVRYTEAEIEQIANDDKYITIYFCLKDKFGDHGLISVVILEKRENKVLFIHEWLMSCRVLKRGMEEFIINTIIETARENGFEKVVGEYIKTPKNAMVSDIYRRMGFIPEEDNTAEEGRFDATVSEFKPNISYITKE